MRRLLQGGEGKRGSQLYRTRDTFSPASLPFKTKLHSALGSRIHCWADGPPGDQRSAPGDPKTVTVYRFTLPVKETLSEYEN